MRGCWSLAALGPLTCWATTVLPARAFIRLLSSLPGLDLCGPRASGNSCFGSGSGDSATWETGTWTPGFQRALLLGEEQEPCGLLSSLEGSGL